MIGQKFGRLTVIGEGLAALCPSGTRQRRMICRCDCGTEKVIRLIHLRSGKIRSCGCLRPARKLAIGGRFGRLVVLEESESRKFACGATRKQYLCQCDCGNKKIIDSGNLKGGDTKSCGCLHRELRIQRNVPKHGHASGNVITGTYTTWRNMKARCANPKDRRFKDYGGRGISVCDRWLESFENFLADMGERPDGLTLERVDNDGNYEPGNCKWATRKEQNNNSRNIVRVPYGQKGMSMAEFARMHGIPYAKFKYCYRVKKLTLEQILSAEKPGSETSTSQLPKQPSSSERKGPGPGFKKKHHKDFACLNVIETNNQQEGIHGTGNSN